MRADFVTKLRAGRNTELAVRVALAAVAVVICYQFQWHWLRYVTSELNLRCDWLAGIPIRRLTFDTVTWNGVIYRYEIACIFADVWCGSIPLLWKLDRTIPQNLGRLALFSAALLAFNIARLSFSDVLYSWAVPWPIAHSLMGGVAWFLVWVWLWRNLSLGGRPAFPVQSRAVIRIPGADSVS
jgi:hypothetical protein